MDRKNSYKAKTTTSALNREKRQFLETKQRKDDRKNLIMSKRGLSNVLGKEGAKKNDEDIKNKENNKPKLVRDTGEPGLLCAFVFKCSIGLIIVIQQLCGCQYAMVQCVACLYVPMFPMGLMTQFF